jgi:hypothetical protein
VGGLTTSKISKGCWLWKKKKKKKKGNYTKKVKVVPSKLLGVVYHLITSLGLSTTQKSLREGVVDLGRRDPYNFFFPLKIDDMA